MPKLDFYLPKGADPTINEALNRIAEAEGVIDDETLDRIVDASREDRERWLLREAKREAKAEEEDD